MKRVVMLRVVLLNVVVKKFLLSVIKLRVIILNVVAPRHRLNQMHNKTLNSLRLDLTQNLRQHLKFRYLI